MERTAKFALDYWNATAKQMTPIIINVEEEFPWYFNGKWILADSILDWSLGVIKALYCAIEEFYSCEQEPPIQLSTALFDPLKTV